MSKFQLWFHIIGMLLATLIIGFSVAMSLCDQAHSAPVEYWCSNDNRQLFVTTGTASILYSEGGSPNYLPQQEEVLVPVNADDPLDLRAHYFWKIEGHMFRPCRSPPRWARELAADLPDEMPVPGRK